MAAAVGVSKDTVKRAKRAARAGGAKPRQPQLPKVDKRDTQLVELKSTNEALRDEIEQVREGAQEAIDQAETAAALLQSEPAKETLKLKAEIRRLEHLRDKYVDECGQLRKQIKIVERERDKCKRLREAA